MNIGNKAGLKGIWKIVLPLLFVAALCIYPLMTIQDSEFGGADGEAMDVVLELAPDYQPWAEPLFPPPGGETESLLFCLQAGIGAGIFGFGAGYLFAMKKQKSQNGKQG